MIPARRQYALMAFGFAAGFIGTPLLVSLANWALVAGGPSVEQKIALATTRQLALALDQYRRDHFSLPDRSAGLQALVPTYTERIPQDPWDHHYIYTIAPDGSWADVISHGGDGQSAGSGAAGDISGRFGLLTPEPSWFVRLVTQGVFFVFPLVGVFGAARWPWAAGMLAGCADLFALLLLALIDAFGLDTLLALTAAIACLGGSIAMLQQTRGAPLFTFVSFIVAYALLGELITT